MEIDLRKIKNLVLKAFARFGDVHMVDLPFYQCLDPDVHVLKKDIGKCHFTKWRTHSILKTIFSLNGICSRISDISIPRRKSKRVLSLSNMKSKWHFPMKYTLFQPEFQIIKSPITTKFLVLEEISKGAFGRVHKVKDVNSGAIYALKVLLKSDVISGDDIRQLKNEVQIHKTCGHHLFIVNCVHTFQSHSLILIVTDYQKNGDLFGLLERYIVTEAIAKLYIAEIALIFDFLHNVGVIYRDLKPENILLDEQYHVCLTDFGLSKWLSRGSKTNTICGTNKYMAPEIDGGPYTHAIDWWSLGILACRMITGQFPEINMETMVLPTLTDQNIPVKDLLQRLLIFDPMKRLRSLYALKTTAFYKNYDFSRVMKKQINAPELLNECEERGTQYDTSDTSIFVDF